MVFPGAQERAKQCFPTSKHATHLGHTQPRGLVRWNSNLTHLTRAYLADYTWICGENAYHSRNLHEPLSRIFSSVSKAHNAALHVLRAGFPELPQS